MGNGIIQPSFTAGELAPSLYGRVDLNRYYTGLRKCENFIVRQFGGVSNRPGLKFVADLVEPCRLIPFQFSTVQTYVLAFGNYTMRIFTNGGQVVYPVGHAQAGQPVVITTLYPVTALSRLKYIQNADVMTICHPDYPPQQLSRTNHHVWTFAVFNNVEGPFLDINVDGTKTLNVSAVTGNVTITAMNDIFTSDMVGRMIYIEQSPDALTKKWEVQKSIGINDIRRAGLNYYKAISSGTTGTVRPDHTDGTAYDGDPGVAWQYLHSGFGIALITNYSTPWLVTASVLKRMPDMVVTNSTVKNINSVNPGGGVGGTVRLGVTAHGFTTGTSVIIQGVTGTIGANGTWQISVVTADVFDLLGCIDNTPHTGGGTVTFALTALPTYKWALEAWGGAEKYPACTTYYQQRQCFAANAGKPQTTWMSRTKGYLDFGTSNPILDDDSLNFTVASREVNEIRHMIELSELILLTSGGEWMIRGGQDGTLIPSTVNVKRQGHSGSSHIAPVVVDSHALFVQEKGSQVRSLGYSFQQDAFVGQDLTVLASHLFQGHTLVDMAYQRVPYSCVWAVRDDGTLLGLTYMPAQDVVGWHRHTTDGQFKSVCCISEGTEDAVYVAIDRTVGGVTKHYIERLATRTSDEYAFFVDSGLSYIGVSQPFFTILSGSMARDIIVDYTNSRTPTGSASILFSTTYDYDYVGPVSGSVQGVLDFSQYRVDVYSTTDIDYFMASSELSAIGAWSVASADRGVKTAKLVRKSDGSIVAEKYVGTGLVRSYQVPESDIAYPFLKDRCFLYDQAVAIVMACCLNDIGLAQLLTNGLMRSIDANGGEVCFSVNHKNGAAPDIYVRTGATAWVLYALAFFAYKFPGSAIITNVNAYIDTVANKLIPYQVQEAGYQQYAFRGGKGKYSIPDYLTFDPNYLVGWCSTEHNIDCYFAFALAGTVRGNATYTNIANQVKTALLGPFWSNSNQRLVQGISNQTTKDYADALDCHSWGSIFLRAVGETAKADIAYAGMELFKTEDRGVKGYRPYSPDAGYPNAGTGVWGEGTLGVVLARFAKGDVAQGVTDYNNLVAAAGPFGLQYSTLRDYIYELSDWPSVASTAWMIIAAKPAGFWGVTADNTAAIIAAGGQTLTPASSFSGLGHLEGKTVAILADGKVHPPQVVTGGAISLYYSATVIHAGLPIVANLETLDLSAPSQNIRDKQKLVNHVSLLVDESKSVAVGPDGDHLTEHPASAVVSGPESEIIDVRVQGTWSKTGRVLVRQDKPLPLTILAVIPEVNVGGA